MSNYEEVVRVPLIVRPPPSSPYTAGSTVSHYVQLLDLFPSLVSLAGLPSIPSCPQVSSISQNPARLIIFPTRTAVRSGCALREGPGRAYLAGLGTTTLSGGMSPSVNTPGPASTPGQSESPFSIHIFWLAGLTPRCRRRKISGSKNISN